MARHRCLEKPSVVPLLAEVAVLEARRAIRQTRRKLVPATAIDPSHWQAPDSKLARDAEALCQLHSSPGLAGHCSRTYAFGMALSGALNRKPDRELLYIAAQLHDLGLTEAFEGPGPFEFRGAEAAYAWCIEQGLAESKAELVHEAIRVHTSLVAARKEPEVALVHFGAGADVIGYHLEDINAAVVAEILEIWPREDFKSEIHALLQAQVRKCPDSPASVQWRFGFGKRILAAPFAE